MNHRDDTFCIWVCKRHSVLVGFFFFLVLNMGRCKRKVILQDYFIWLYLLLKSNSLSIFSGDKSSEIPC